MQVSDFDFDLPEQLIAKKPLQERDASRLLSLSGSKETPFLDGLIRVISAWSE